MKNNYSSELLTPSIIESQGIGGKIKHFPEDFIVSEIIDKEKMAILLTTFFSKPA